MKMRHNIPIAATELRSDPISPEYQAEVDRTMARAENAWNRARRRLEAAERRLQRARTVSARTSRRQTKRQVEELEALVELRRVELEQVHRLMVATGTPATSRGRSSFRPIPQPGGPL